MINLKDKRALMEARRAVKDFKSGRLREFKAVGQGNLITFLETALRIIDQLENEIENLGYELREEYPE